MLNVLNIKEIKEDDWLTQYWLDFRKRFISLLAYQFSKFSPGLALGMLANKAIKIKPEGNSYECGKKYVRNVYMLFLDMSREELDVHLTKYDIKRLEMYSNNLVDYHLIMDLVPTLAKVYFLNRMGSVQMSAVQSVS